MSEPHSESPIEARLVPSHEDPPSADHVPSTNQRLVQSRSAVFAMLFLVTGVLGIPLLWMNRNFSNNERIFWSIVVTIYTAVLIAIAAAIVIWSYRRIVGY